MKRYINTELAAWKIRSSRKPLILQGARQVGKTHALEAFGKEAFSEYLRIDFDKDQAARELFEYDLNPDRIIEALRLRYEKDLKPGESLIIFDEIQECPNALNSLKYFCEDAPQFHVASAGSLLGVKLKGERGFPVGKVDFLRLYPMSFLEFLRALGHERLYESLSKITRVAPIEEVIHKDLCELYKVYCYVGGMPEAVQSYILDKDYKNVRRIQDSIITAYIYDVSKHAPQQQIMKITALWHSLPQQLAKANKKFKFSLVHKHARFRDYKEAIQWLLDAGLIYAAYDIATPKLPLSGYMDTNGFKLYALDVGLLGAMSQLSASIILEDNKLFTEYKGSLTENSVIQLLRVAGFSQNFYWTLDQRAEVDFVLQLNQDIVPLEIKAGQSRHKKSMQFYTEKYAPTFRFRGSLMNLKQDGNFFNIPLYLLERFLNFEFSQS